MKPSRLSMAPPNSIDQHRHAIPIDQVPTLPACEENNAYHDEREQQPGWQNRGFATHVSRVPIIKGAQPHATDKRSPFCPPIMLRRGGTSDSSMEYLDV
jgi:hypothetical protein